MDNYNNNGQFGGWVQNTGGYYGRPVYNEELYRKEQEKKKDRKSLKDMGFWFGSAVNLFVLISFVISFITSTLVEFFPSLNLIYTDSVASAGFDIIASIVYILMPFALVHIVLKTKKLTGVLPFGTSYNGKASAFLTMAVLPVMMIVSVAINYISLIIQESLDITFTSALDDVKIIGLSGFLMSIISTAILPAIIEETIIRGIVLQPLRRYGDLFALVISSLLFSIMHGNMVQIPYTFTAGMFFGYVAIATGSLWPSIIMHFINNFYAVIIMAASDNYSEASANVVSFMFMGLLIIFGIVGFVLFRRMNYSVKFAKGIDTLKVSEKIKSFFLNGPMIMAIIIMVFMTVATIEF